MRVWRHAAPVLGLAIAIAIAVVVANGGLCVAGCSDALTFDGNFNDGLSAWNRSGGGAQCANYGTPSLNQRLRGDFVFDGSVAVPGATVGRFDVPAATPGFLWEGCELTHPVALGLGSDQYYGFMFYVPNGWTTGTSQFWGITVAQFHFQNIWGSPIEFQLENDHMTLALETGACSNYLTATPGCRYRSNADAAPCVSDSTHTCLAAQHAVPSPMAKGVWHELIMHVHWASDSSGQVEVWHRIAGQANWTQTVRLSGYPTVQWDAAQGCCAPAATDKVGAYRGLASVPVSVWEDNILVGPDFATVAANLALTPLAPVAPPPVRTPRAAVSARPIHAGPACVLASRRNTWLRNHRRPGSQRHRMLAMRRVVVRRRHWVGHRQDRRLVTRPVTYYCPRTAS